MASPNASSAVALLLAAAAVVFQCFVPPNVGLADNGDFPKIAGQFDVGNPLFSKDVSRFADFKYVVDSKYHWDSQFYSSELLLFAAAFGLDSISGKPDTFDLRLMGAIHAAIFLLAFYRLLPLLKPLRPALRILLLGLILLFFTDVMYVGYFNSFFMDTGALLFLLLTVVSFLRALRWQRPVDRWLFVASSMLLVTSKTQHFLLGIPIALLLIWKGGLLTPGRGRAFRTFSTVGAMRLLVVRSVVNAAPACWPRIRSTTSRAFCGEIRIYRASAFACMLSSMPCRTGLPACPSYAGFELFSVAAFTEWPLKVRVGENSPNLCPTMFSVTYTGINFLPLCTPKVWPMNSGLIVDRRDHVLTTRLSPFLFISSILTNRCSSTNGPFLTDLGMD